MPHLLQLDSSISGEGSRSRAIARSFADAWTGTITYRDLAAEPLPYLTESTLHWAPHRRTDGAPERPEGANTQDSVIEQLLAADVLLIAAPLYNYTVPATIKTWLDYIHVVGTTFSGTQPMAGRTAVVVSTRGGSYETGTKTEGWDHGVPVLQIVLGNALGMTVEVIQSDRTLSVEGPDAERTTADFEAARAAAADAARRLS